MDNQPAEVRVKLVIDGNAVKAMDALTGAVKRTASAEAELRGKVEQTNKTIASRRSAGAGGSGPGGAIGVGGATAGHVPGGRLGAAGDAVLGRFGVGRVATAAGGAAAAVGVLHMGAEASIAAGRIRADPYSPDSARNEALARNVPVLGAAFGMGLDYYRANSGRDEEYRQLQRAGHENAIRAQFANQQASVRFGVGFQEQSQQIRAQTFAGLHLQRPAGHDRSTVQGQKLYEEEAAMLPLIRQRQLAMKERLAAEKTSGLAAKEEAGLQQKLTQQDKELAYLKQRRAEIDKPGSESRNNDRAREDLQIVYGAETALRAQRDHTAQQLAGAQQRTAQTRGEAAQAGFREKQVEATVQRQEASTLRQREQTATGQARNLAAMGLEGRTRGKFALQIIQQMGIENVDAQTQQEAAAIAPEMVGKMQEAAGGKMLPEFARLSPEYRDTNLSDIRQRADQAQERATSTEEGAISDVESGMAAALQGLADRLVKGLESAMNSALDGFAQRMEQQVAARNFGGGG